MGSGAYSMVEKIAFLFPGQGSQSIGMGQSMAAKSQRAAQLIKSADDILGFSLSKIMFEGPEEELKKTAVTQPALFVASAAALEWLRENGIQPSLAAGHSLGEYSALYCAGVLNFEDALKLVYARGSAMNEAALNQPGVMAAILGLPFDIVNSVCAEASGDGSVCSLANFNAESQIVISGNAEAVQKATQLAKAAGALKVVPLNVSGAFHSILMSPAALRMRSVLQSVSFSNASIPVVTNVDALPTREAADFKEKLILQIDHSVLWHSSVVKLTELGATVFIEVGAGRVLSTLARKWDKTKTILSTEEPDTVENHKRRFSCV